MAVMAGVYSAVLDNMETAYNLNTSVSAVLLVLFTFTTGYMLYKVGQNGSEE
ncbi:hypothetical protein [Bacillus sp. BHET2]|uniref:hypothetical protein n=1 Tax=Bacillus sp. BHET2 TaxID=2583818 RepID=UPI001485EA2F|nr:hypothetical protein [Bacillus sp. BHET2]